MIDKIDANQFQDPLETAPPKQADAAKTPQSNQPDASLHVNHASLISQAMQVPQDDPQAVPKARELLLSGQLESPDNFRQAAENIVTLGI